MNVFQDGVVCRAYYGCLVGNSDDGLTFQRVVKKYYDGVLFGLLHTFSWGGYEARDTDIMEDLGLAYRSFRCDINDEARQYYVWRDDRWRSTEFVNPLTSIFEFLSKQSDLVDDLRLEIGGRWKGGILSDDSVGEHKLRDLVDLKEAKRRNIFWSGEIKRCDLCGHDFENDQYMADTSTKCGFWANVCSRCFDEREAQIGWGKGQLYLRTDDGWLLVAGFGPEEDE
jgi:hypothetical protein